MEKNRELLAKIALTHSSRREIAEYLRIPYSTLSTYLGGFAPWPQGMERKIESFLSQTYKKEVANVN